MGLILKIKEDLKTAMKSGDQFSTGVLRMMTSTLHNREIEKKAKDPAATLSEEEIISILGTEVKKRKESIEAFTKGGRPELAENEQKEVALIQKYLPAQMDAAQIPATVKKIIETSGAKDFPAAIKAVMAQLKGKADSKLVTEAVKAHFGA